MGFLGEGQSTISILPISISAGTKSSSVVFSQLEASIGSDSVLWEEAVTGACPLGLII